MSCVGVTATVETTAVDRSNRVLSRRHGLQTVFVGAANTALCVAQVADECVPLVEQVLPCVLGAQQPRIRRLGPAPLGSTGILHLSPSTSYALGGCPCVVRRAWVGDRGFGDDLRREAGALAAAELLIRVGERQGQLLSWRAVRAFWL